MATLEEWALKMIPVLVRWAQTSWDKPHYYSQLSMAVGLNTNRISRQLGQIHDIIRELSKKTGRDIPTLNCLVMYRSTGLPADGFDYVVPNYSQLTDELKKIEVRRLCNLAHIYDWTWVLKELNLEEYRLNVEIGTFVGGGGEGEQHKQLKKYVAEHPWCIGVKKREITKIEKEKPLLSGDKLDVYFECTNRRVAVEVKPQSSFDGDVLRGIFQCVKYQSVMDATSVVDNSNCKNEVFLVVGGELSDSNRLVANELCINYIELKGNLK